MSEPLPVGHLWDIAKRATCPGCGSAGTRGKAGSGEQWRYPCGGTWNDHATYPLGLPADTILPEGSTSSPRERLLPIACAARNRACREIAKLRHALTQAHEHALDGRQLRWTCECGEAWVMQMPGFPGGLFTRDGRHHHWVHDRANPGYCPGTITATMLPIHEQGRDDEPVSVGCDSTTGQTITTPPNHTHDNEGGDHA